MEERNQATKKILERMKADDAGRSFGSSDLVSDDDLDSDEDDDDDDDTMSPDIGGGGVAGGGGKKSKSAKRPNGPVVNR